MLEKKYISRILLTSVNVLLCVLVFCITSFIIYFGAIGSSWSGSEEAWFDLIFDVKGYMFLGILAFLAIVGQSEKLKFGFLCGLGLSISIGLYGLLATLFDYSKSFDYNGMDVIALFITSVIGIGLFLWNKYELKLKHKIFQNDWIIIAVLSGTCTTLLLID